MSVRNSLIAIGALSASLLQGMKSPVPLSATKPAEREARKPQQIVEVRIPFSPPTHKLVSRQLKAGFVHVYPLPLKAGERVEVIAYQDGVDLKAALFDPVGRHLFTVNSPNGTKGDERIFWVADVSGQYRIDISCSEKCTIGAYRIWVNDESQATAQDKKDARAESLFYQAKEEKKNPKAFHSQDPDEKLRQASMLWEEIGKRGRQADALSILGVSHFNQGKWRAALQEFDRTRSLYRGLKQTADEGRMDNNIGVIHEIRLDLTSALNNFKQALSCGESSHDQGVIAAAYENIGTIFYKQGRAEEALDNLRQALRAWKGLNPVKEAETLISMGGVFVGEGKWALAKEKYNEALAVLGSGKDPRIKALALQGMGNLYLKTHEMEQALHSFEGAFAIQQQAGLLNDMPTSLNGWADVLLNERRPQDALDPFKKALKIFEKLGDPRNQARVLTNLGWTYAALHRDDDARLSYERALALAKRLDSWTAAAALLGLSRLEETRGDPIAAQRQAEAAVRYVEDLRAAAGHEFRISFFATRQDVYNQLIEILFWQHSLKPGANFDAQALQVSEQARSRGLLDSVSSAGATAGSKYSFSSVPILSLKEIQALLDPDSLLLDYHLGQKASYLWVIGPSSYHVVKLLPQQELETLASRVTQLLKVSHLRERTLEAKASAMELSRALLSPALPWLGRKRLVISAPDVLQSVSFRALPDPAVKDTSPGNKAWPKPLVVEHDIVRIPSASVLAAVRARAAHRMRPHNLLAFLGDAVSDYRDKRLAGIAGVSLSELAKKAAEGSLPHFDRLKNTEDEGNAILKAAGGRGVLSAFGFEATRELVTSGQLSTYDNLHFATHGLVRPNDASRSALVLSLWDRQGHPVNGLLEAADIYRLDLPADLVVLSACDTGLGEHIPGEGIVGLSQAFMGAGATRVMVSLWPVEDHATFRLMESFYTEYLVKGLSPSLALRKAQIEMWKDPNRSAPFYWGGFEIQGDWWWVRDPR